jgi:hypothetical protein
MTVDFSALLVLMTSIVLTTAIAIEGFIARMALENRSRLIKLESQQ